jgi:hypothetical protein
MQDSAEQQYAFTLKFLNYRGIGGAMWHIFRYYVLGLIGTFCFIAYLKRIGHDSANYYKVTFIAMEGKAGWNSGLYPAILQNVREAQRKYDNTDVLGRSKYHNNN